MRRRERGTQVAGPDLADDINPHPGRVVVMPSVEERMVSVEKGLEGVTEDIRDIKAGVDKMNDRMASSIQVVTDKLAGRPSWAVLAIFTVQTTAIGILATLVATGS
jgi:hypothetical protein